MTYGKTMKVSANRVMRKFFWDSYDNLGIIILGNLLWFGLCLPIVTAPASTAALFSLTNRVISGKGASLKDFWEGFRKYFLRSLSLGLIYLLLLAVLKSDLFLYQHLSQTARVVVVFLGAVNFWIFLLFSLMGIYSLPLMVEQDIGLRKSLKRSALLALDNPFFTIAISIQVMAIFFLSLLSGVGVILLMMSLVSLLLNRSLRELFNKYEEGGEEEKEERKSLREIFRPWQ